jgi:hypothetical protein
VVYNRLNELLVHHQRLSAPSSYSVS